MQCDDNKTAIRISLTRKDCIERMYLKHSERLYSTLILADEEFAHQYQPRSSVGWFDQLSSGICQVCWLLYHRLSDDSWLRVP